MAASKNKNKNKKVVKQKEQPLKKETVNTQNPDSCYDFFPSWCFNISDKNTEECTWAFHRKRLECIFWDEILPFLVSLEKSTWCEIIQQNKKHNHPIETKDLNKVARDRLAKLMIEAESIISLRLSGTHRIYGLLNDFGVFSILWFDDNHGDNEECVCRSKLKYT